jgi:DNA-binding transcriptional ArsR family regulator
MEDIDASQEAGVFRALADSTRRQILEELRAGELRKFQEGKGSTA